MWIAQDLSLQKLVPSPGLAANQLLEERWGEEDDLQGHDIEGSVDELESLAYISGLSPGVASLGDVWHDDNEVDVRIWSLVAEANAPAQEEGSAWSMLENDVEDLREYLALLAHVGSADQSIM